MGIQFLSCLKHKSRALDKVLITLYDIVLTIIVIGWTIQSALCHHFYKHWWYKKQDGYCWVCRSYEESQETDKWLLEYFKEINN